MPLLAKDSYTAWTNGEETRSSILELLQDQWEAEQLLPDQQHTTYGGQHIQSRTTEKYYY